MELSHSFQNLKQRTDRRVHKLVHTCSDTHTRVHVHQHGSMVDLVHLLPFLTSIQHM
jgi:hypothetical protein